MIEGQEGAPRPCGKFTEVNNNILILQYVPDEFVAKQVIAIKNVSQHILKATDFMLQRKCQMSKYHRHFSSFTKIMKYGEAI